MFLRMLIALILLGIFGFAGLTYMQFLQAKYVQKEEAFKEEIELLKRNIKDDKNYKSKIQSKVKVEYDVLKKQLEDKYRLREKALVEKYGSFAEFKRKVREDNHALEQELNQRQDGLEKLSQELAVKEREISQEYTDIARKRSEVMALNVECKIFDLKRLDEYVKQFQSVAYATRQKVNLLCGLNPSNKTLVNYNACLKSRSDREKARSLLALIESVGSNITKGSAYLRYAGTQRVRMNIPAPRD